MNTRRKTSGRVAAARVVRARVAGALIAAGALAGTTAALEARPGGLQAGLLEGERLPTGMRLTPTVARDARFTTLNPDLPTRPDYLVDHAVSTALSPDGQTLLVLTTGYNRNNNPAGQRIAAESNEYVFVYDVRGGHPVKQQVLQVANTFVGIAWNPRGDEFYVAGGVDDNVQVFARSATGWIAAATVPLGHAAGAGLGTPPMASGIAVNPAGTQLLVANYENDSVTLLDLAGRRTLAELDLRPGKNDAGGKGVPGGEYPFWVVWRDDGRAYVSNVRDREIVALTIAGATPAVAVAGRIKVAGQPNKMILNHAGTRLYVACDNSDSVAVIDSTGDAGPGTLIEQFNVAAPREVFPRRKRLKGANPNGLALSPDEGTLFVSDGGLNAVAVVQLGRAPGHHRDRPRDDDDDDDDDDGEREESAGRKSRVIGLIPTGWYPSAVSVSRDGGMLYVLNTKSNAGPNPGACRDTLSTAAGALGPCTGHNQYVWQLHKAGFLSMPMPTAAELATLTWQVAFNNKFEPATDHDRAKNTMGFLRGRIEHVIYVVKENRTYDQIHGTLPKGNGDPSLAILAPYSPNHQQLARSFVTLDNFYDSGETSNTGWNWTTGARATDFTEKTSPVNYAGRGLTYDWEGANRNINVGLPTVAERQAADPATPSDPDLLAGTADVAAPDSPGGEAGTGYLWDAALRAGLSVRNYGFFVANLGASAAMPPETLAHPFAAGVKQAVATKPALAPHTDPYFRGYDQNNADFYLFKEWEREFDAAATSGDLPNLSLVRLPHDHFGNFGTAKFGVNTVETQMADNDYAVGLLIEKVAHSRWKDSTLIFVIENDAQNGADHVDPHRSVAYVVGPYVKQGAIVSRHYTTVSMLRTMEEVLGLQPLGLYDGLADPMAEIFDPRQRHWDYQAVVPQVLYTTQLPLPPQATAKLAATAQPRRDARYWTEAMAGQNFAEEDHLDEARFNRALWVGLQGEGVPFPTRRDGRDLRADRARLLERHAAAAQREARR
jgi:DNA-binding beta-propeller fold protein YncE